MEVTFLGTGTSGGVPMVGCSCEVCRSTDPKDKRLRSSVLINVDGKTLVIDSSPDFRQQMLRENVKNIDAIIFTHAHKDHTGGLDDIRAYNYLLKKAIPLYFNRETFEIIKRQYDYIFTEKDYPGVPKIEEHLIENKPFEIGGTTIIPIEVWHYKMRVFAYRIFDFTYITDANRIEEEEKEKIRGSKVVVINALRKEKHLSHFTLGEAIDLAKELGVEKAYLTHLSHQMGLYAEVSKELPENVELAYDGLKLEI